MAEEKTSNWSDEKVKRFLGKQSEVELRVAKALDEMELPFTVMILVEPKNYTFIKNAIITKYNTDDQYIIYISLNTSYQKALIDFNKDRKELSNVYFVDLISVNSGAKIINGPNVDYMNSPSELTECIMLVEKKLEELQAEPKKRNVLIILDSVITVSVYNDTAVVEKFVHVLIGKVSSFNASAILLSPDYEESKSLTETIEQFMDKTVKI